MVLCYCVVIIDWTVVLATHASNRHQGGCLPAAIDTETYQADYSAAELKEASLLLEMSYNTAYRLRYMRGRNHLIWRKLQVSVRYICIHIIHIPVYP